MAAVVWLGGIEPWCFQVEAHPGESFGHFLGRFRRANAVTSKGLAAVLDLQAALVAQWEIPSMGRTPTEENLSSLSHLCGVSVDILRTMRPAQRSELHLGTRLCGMCYAQTPVHLVAWQSKAKPFCERHKRQLLSACPGCGKGFPTPSRWEMGACWECLLPYEAMGTYQQPHQEVPVVVAKAESQVAAVTQKRSRPIRSKAASPPR
jgi:hypothetical protein